ncbi:MAG: type II CRISPR RNA-guided endonuclease Cas9 [Flavobacteriales bacterium]|nr:type II CRISPR RNA-guided endonuclease Cas9 [Flavobacteriales bacterium]
MVCGAAWSHEQWSAGLQRSVQRVIDNRGDDSMKEEMRRAVAHLTSIEQFTGLPYWVAATVAYGDHRAITGKPIEKPEWIKSMPRGFLRNPTVEQVVNEALMVVRDIWKEYGKPDSFRIELARELRQNQEQRASAHERNRKRNTERKKTADTLIKEFNRPKPSRKDIDKHDLWKQQQQRCMYCGQGIQKPDLFNTREADIDHIIPQSRFYDDSLTNRVIVHRKCNAGREGKDDMLAATYMKSKGDSAYQEYVGRISEWDLPYGKRKLLLAEEVPDGFINRQLNETRYIGTELRKLLERIAPVNTTVGQVTDALKNEWGLTTVYKEVLKRRFERLERITGRKLIEEIHRTNGAKHVDYKIEGYDKRIDHRHHALDALVVALTRQRYIQKIAQLKQRERSPHPR